MDSLTFGLDISVNFDALGGLLANGHNLADDHSLAVDDLDGNPNENYHHKINNEIDSLTGGPPPIGRYPGRY